MASAAGNYTDPNLARSKKIKEKRGKLCEAVEKYDAMLLEDWLDMMGSFYD